jgi:hypothetical protein
MPIVDPFKSQQTGGIVDPFKTQEEPEPTESGGFFGSYKQALKERANTALPAGQLYFGAGDQRAATDELLKAKDEANAVYKQTEFSDLGKAFKEGRFGDALGGTLDKFKEVAGSSLGSQTPAIAAGLGTRLAVAGGAAALGVATAPAALIGTAAWGLTTLGSYIADNLARQKEEQAKKGLKYEDVNRMTATAAGVGQTALDAFGFSYFKPLGRLVGFSGKESAEKAAMEIVQAATDPKAYRKAIATGVAQGIAFEVPQEVSQQVLERWQAGLALNPFTDPEAAKEYLEAAGGAMLLGGPMGAYSKGVDTYKTRQTPEAQVMLRDMEGGAAQDIGGEPDVNKPISPPGGTGAPLVSEPGAGAPAAGAGINQPNRVDDAGQTIAGPPDGTAVQPGALEEPPGLLDNMPGMPVQTSAGTLPALAPQNVDEYAARAQQGMQAGPLAGTQTVSAKYGNEDFALTRGAVTPDAVRALQDEQLNKELSNVNLSDAEYALVKEEQTRRKEAPAQINQQQGSLSDFKESYENLRSELLKLQTEPRPTAGQIQMMSRLASDISALVDANAEAIVKYTGQPELVKDVKSAVFQNRKMVDPGVNATLKNPTFDATEVLRGITGTTGQPRAMQGNLFGKFINGAHNAQLALAHTGSPQAAIKFLQDKRQRLASDLASGKLDAAWAQKIGARFGMNQGESVRNYKKVAELYTQAAIAEVDAALDQLSKQAGTPKAIQGNLFNKPLEEGAPAESMESVFGLTANEVAEQEARRKSAEIEKRNKGQTQAAGASLSPQERLDILTAREADLANRLERAKTQKIGSSVGATETGVVQGIQNELNAVRRDIRVAQTETAKPALEAPAPKVTTTPVKVESKQTQNEMFDEVGGTKKPRKEQPKKERKAPTSIAEDFEEFGAEAAEDEQTEAATEQKAREEEVERKAAEARQAEEDKTAPDTSTEHVDKTEEAQAIKRFLDAINSAARPKSKEAEKITSLKDVIYKLLSRFDITKPGERSSPGLKAAYKFLTDIAGGEAKFEKLMTSLQNPGTMSQAQLLERAGFPNITTRRGLDEFKDQVQNFINALGAKGQRVKIEPGKVAYESDVEVETKRAMTPGVTPEGKIRRPSMEGGTKQFKVSDSKLRSAWTTLKQMFDSGGNVTPEMLAAKAYITNPTRPKFGFVLADLAHDLARWDAFLEAKYGMRAADVKEMTAAERKKLPQTAEQEKLKTDFGRNATFFGEGGMYAENFQRWIEQNLDPKTIATLNEMVANERANMDEEIKFNKAVSLFNLEVQKRKTASAQARIAAAEKATNQQLRLEKRKQAKEAMAAVEGIETEGEEKLTEAPVDLRGIPEREKLHPAVVRAIKDGDLNGALKIIAGEKTNGYFKQLAARLLESGLTAKTKIIPKDSIESLSNDPQVKETFNNQLRALRDMVETSLPEAQREELISALTSKNLYDISAAVLELKGSLINEAQQQIVDETMNLMNKEFAWDAKYDPESDTLTMRQGSLDNTVLFHEALHAATINLIDNPDKLSGARKVAYNRLLELYNYSKGTLANEHLGNYGLKDLHEFVSEAMSNPDFQALLRALRYKSAPFSLWNEFTNAITKLFKTPSKEESDVMVEVMRATNILMAGPMAMDSMTSTKSTPKAMARVALKAIPQGLKQTPSTMKRLMTASEWNEVKRDMPWIISSATASTRPQLLGALTLRQIDDLVRDRIPQVGNFIRVTERFLARKNNILQESGKISERWYQLQRANPELSRRIAKLMHAATIRQYDPDPKMAAEYTNEQRIANPEITTMWKQLPPEAKAIYVEVRDFYSKRYEEYKLVMENRIKTMRELGVSEKSITNIRAEFEKSRTKGPYFPLMRHGRFWYQIGTGDNREYYMFETRGQKEKHMAQRVKDDPDWPIKQGDTYKGQMDLHAQQSTFLQNAFAAIDGADFSGVTGEAQRQALKDGIYQNYLSNQPEQSFRRQFMNRNNIAGYSEDALRNFARSSFHMAYQISRFENSPDMFSNIQAARMQIKDRFDASKGYDQDLARENNELSDYVTEMEKRLQLMLNPPDSTKLPSILSNIGFIWYLTAPASAITNVLGGAIIGIPTLVGMNLRMNPGMTYAQATVNALWHTKKAAGQILSTGFGNKEEGYFPSMGRFDNMTGAEKQAYDRFVADGLIDITATYDQSGLASSPTDSQFSAHNKVMTALTGLFHNAERFNREVMAMSAFRQAMDARKGYKDQTQAYEEAVLEAKDVTHRAMFDYSSANKPRYFQHPVASVILQFKQFPQQMTFFLAHNAVNMFKGQSPEIRREARARFVGTMGMAGIFSGVTGLWGFSTVASIMNAVVNGLGDDDEEPFDFELEFVNWAINTFGQNLGTMVTRGIGNTAGIDLASRTKLDDMWFRDGRKNQDEVESLQTFLIDLLGPTVGLTINVAEAAKLWNEGHGDRAIEMISPAFIKSPLVAARYANEGVNTLRGDPLMEDMGPFLLLMQSVGIRSSELAERQFYNIQVKGQEQAVLKERQNLLNLFGIAMIANDSDSVDKALGKIDKFNTKHPSVFIPSDAIIKSIDGRMKKMAETDHGLYIDKRMRGVLDGNNYVK